MKIKTQLVPLFTRLETLHVTSLQMAQMALSVLAGMGVAASLLPQPVLADPNYDQPLQQLQKDQQNQDPFSSSNDSSNFNVMNLIHQAQQGGPLRDLNDFSQEQGHNLDTAAAKFRLQQQQLLRNQNQAAPATPVTPSSSVQQ